MQPTLCARCKKNVAVVFISRMNEKNEQVSEGLCLQCAAKLGLPQVEDMMKRMGITPEDLESLSGEMMQAFGGAEELEDVPDDDGGDEDESGTTATFPRKNESFWIITALTFPTAPGRASWMPSLAGSRRSSGWCRF